MCRILSLISILGVTSTTTTNTCQSKCCEDLESAKLNPQYYRQLKSYSGNELHFGRSYGDIISEGSFSSCNRLAGLGGKYCFKAHKNDSTGIYECLPKSCTAETANELLGPKSLYRYEVCYTNTHQHSTIFKVGMIILGLWILLILFSPWTKIRFTTTVSSLFTRDQPSTSLKSLHGIRVLSICWVASFHTMGFAVQTSKNKNLTEVKNYFLTEQPLMIILNSGPLAVDTFFVIGGILAGYILPKKMNNTTMPRWKFLIFNTISRCIRLSPPILAYAAVGILFYQTNTNTEPVFPAEMELRPERNFIGCLNPKSLFATAFFGYISEIDTWEDSCLGYLWYVSCEFWYFVFAVLVLVIFIDKPRFVKISIISAIAIGVLMTFAIQFANRFYFGADMYGSISPFDYPEGWNSSGDWFPDFFKSTYYLPWCRVGPYMIGVLVGMWLQKSGRKLHLKSYQKWTLFILSFLMINLIIFLVTGLLIQGIVIPGWLSPVYEATHRSIWGFSVAVLVVLMETGNFDILYSLLGSDWWMVPSKLGYSAYITHLLVSIKVFSNVFYSDFYYTWQLCLILNIYVCIAMYFNAFLLYTFFEVPLAEIFNFLLNKFK